jgi:hypothetical protein
MNHPTPMLAVCSGCATIADREEFTHCPDCDSRCCMNCDCSCSAFEAEPSALRLKTLIMWQDSRQWLLERLDGPLAALLTVVLWSGRRIAPNR